MINFSKSLAILFLTLLVLSTCEQEETPQPEPQEESVVVVLLHESSYLREWVNELYASSLGGGTHSLLEDVDFSCALKGYNSKTEITHYSFPMEVKNELSMRQFILTENAEGARFGHVFEYEIEAEWYATQSIFPGWDQYTGYFRVLDMQGYVLAKNRIENGGSVKAQTAGGRISSLVCGTRTFEFCATYYEEERCWYQTETTCIDITGSGAGPSGVEMEPTRVFIDAGGGSSNSQPTSSLIVVLDDNQNHFPKISYRNSTNSQKAAHIMNYTRYSKKRGVNGDTRSIFSDIPDIVSDAFKAKVKIGNRTIEITYTEVLIDQDFSIYRSTMYDYTHQIYKNETWYRNIEYAVDCGGCSYPVRSILLQVKESDFQIVFDFLNGD